MNFAVIFFAWLLLLPLAHADSGTLPPGEFKIGPPQVQYNQPVGQTEQGQVPPVQQVPAPQPQLQQQQQVSPPPAQQQQQRRPGLYRDLDERQQGVPQQQEQYQPPQQQPYQQQPGYNAPPAPRFPRPGAAGGYGYQEPGVQFTHICRNFEQGLVWFFPAPGLVAGRGCIVDVWHPRYGRVYFAGIATLE